MFPPYPNPMLLLFRTYLFIYIASFAPLKPFILASAIRFHFEARFPKLCLLDIAICKVKILTVDTPTIGSGISGCSRAVQCIL